MLWIAQASETSVSNDAVWIGAGAIVAAAVIAAIVAVVSIKAEGKRQGAQLSAERERLDDELEAEAKRLDRQLEHDRELTDLAELRTLLDAMMADVRALYDAYGDLITGHEDQLDEEPPSDEGERLRRDLKRAETSATYHGTALTIVVNALRIDARLPEGHAVIAAHNKVGAWLEPVPMPDDPPTQQRVTEMEAKRSALWDAQSGFIAACRTVIGVRLPA